MDIPGLALLKEINRAYPVTRIILPAVALVAALAIIDALEVGWQVAALGSVSILIIVILFFLVAAVVNVINREADKHIIVAGGVNLIRLPAIVIIWAFTLSICAFLGLTISCFFFSAPASLAELLSIRQPLVVSKNETPAQTAPTLNPPSLSPTPPPAGPRLGEDPNLDACLKDLSSSGNLSVSDFGRRARQCISR